MNHARKLICALCVEWQPMGEGMQRPLQIVFWWSPPTSKPMPLKHDTSLSPKTLLERVPMRRYDLD